MVFPVITAPVPTIIPPVAQLVYDRYYISDINIRAADPTQPVVVIVKLIKALIDTNGNWQLSPVDVPQYLRIDDLLGLAATNADIAAVVGGLMVQIGILVTANFTPVIPPSSGS